MAGFLKIIGFIAGFIVCFFLEYLLLAGLGAAAHREFMPRGPGWIVVPIMAGIAGARLLPPLLSKANTIIVVSEREKRFAWVGAIGWLIAFNGYWWIAKPYGYRMHQDDWHTYFAVLVGVPALASVIAFAVKWAMAGSNLPSVQAQSFGPSHTPSSNAASPSVALDKTREVFAKTLAAQLAKAQQEGKPHIDINSGDLHRTVGGYPSNDHRMPTCCAVMRDFMRDGDTVLYTPPLANGATFAVRYTLPR